MGHDRIIAFILAKKLETEAFTLTERKHFQARTKARE